MVNVVCTENMHNFKYCFCKHCWLGINVMLLNASPHCFSFNKKLNEIFMKKKEEGFPVHILEVTVCLNRYIFF